MSKDRFRFRVWDNKLQIYLSHYPLFLEDSGIVYQNLLSMNDCLQEVENVILEQCTGLRDKNGVLIFEADLLGVLFYDGTYENYEVTPPDIDYPAWDLKGFPDVDCNSFSHISNSDDVEEIEVVGNIHEEK